MMCSHPCWACKGSFGGQQDVGMCLWQGHIWTQGYKAGDLQCDLYPDVLPALQHWKAQGVRVYIYSSGSRLAQRDMFAHTQHGDVRKFLSGYFDTSSGAKVGPLCFPPRLQLCRACCWMSPCCCGAKSL